MAICKFSIKRSLCSSNANFLQMMQANMVSQEMKTPMFTTEMQLYDRRSITFKLHYSSVLHNANTILAARHTFIKIVPHRVLFNQHEAYPWSKKSSAFTKNRPFFFWKHWALFPRSLRSIDCEISMRSFSIGKVCIHEEQCQNGFPENVKNRLVYS